MEPNQLGKRRVENKEVTGRFVAKVLAVQRTERFSEKLAGTFRMLF